MAEEKVAYHHHSHSNIFLLIIIVLLLGMFGSFMIFKHVMLKRAMYQYVGQARTYGAIEDRTASTINEAMVFATTIDSVPTDKPLLHSPKDLASYVTTISDQTHRDIVVIDRARIIMADSVRGNVGKKFDEAKNGEVVATIADGTPRTFKEMSTDYPEGLDQVVVPLKDTAATILGAVIMSTGSIK